MTENTPALLRNHRFWLFWGGQSLSKIGDKLHYIALMWYVVNRTDSGMAMGSVLLASSLPIVLCAPKAGELIDRLNRKWLLAAADLLRAGAALGIGWAASSGEINLPLLLLFTALMAVGTAFFQPAVNALLPLIVREEDLLRANSVNESATQTAGLSGPVLAGVFLSVAAPYLVFYLNAFSFLVGALSVLPLIVQQPKVEADRKGGLREGLSYLLMRPALRDIALTFAVLNFAVSFMEVYIPFLNKESFGGGAQELGLIFSAIFAGALLASFGLLLKKDINQWEKVIGGGIILMGLSFAAIFFFRQQHIALSLFLLVGVGWGVFGTNARVYIQKTVEDQRRGRVFALISAVSNLMMPLAYGLAGLAASVLPVYPAFLLGGSVVLFCGLYLFSRRFNHAECQCPA
ncbi:MAG: MFS-type transporter involved in bile tolerance, Atg22 family [Candidatus Electronema aureum]|uniref:MFS-type transporter involved in bile tolerance, Atg22 family n=1 Tax=Candidatus Electronema aureum TaxID=2005002 RepID=A0A521G3Q5_9BACT|nr:MAG: MFS-type transporter involved in bile tolerance, Atg22 family [Candidatus Electronema aureum]